MWVRKQTPPPYEKSRRDTSQIQAIKNMLISEKRAWHVIAIIQPTRARQTNKNWAIVERDICNAVTFGWLRWVRIQPYSGHKKLTPTGDIEPDRQEKSDTAMTFGWPYSRRYYGSYESEISTGKNIYRDKIPGIKFVTSPSIRQSVSKNTAYFILQ